MPISITDLTVHGTTGQGIFDQLMSAVNVHLDEQYKNNRIRGTDYANVYLGSMQWAMEQAVIFLLQKDNADLQGDKLAAEIALLWQKKMTEQAQTSDTAEAVTPVGLPAITVMNGSGVGFGAIGTQRELQNKQRDGYERDAEQKMAKLMVDAWSVRISVAGEAEDVPPVFGNNGISDVINDGRAGIGLDDAV